MAESLMSLEGELKKLPGVLGSVILVDPSGSAAEIQAFVRSGTDRAGVEGSITDVVSSAGLTGEVKAIYVFELDAESVFGDRQTLERAAELAEQDARSRGPLSPPASQETQSRARSFSNRPSLQRVVLSATTFSSEAEVALRGVSEGEVVGLAEGEKTPHGIAVVARATLVACAQLVEGFGVSFVGASLVRVGEQDAVLVLVRLPDGLDLVGSALVREGAPSEAAVRATLDAVNRVLLRSLG